MYNRQMKSKFDLCFFSSHLPLTDKGELGGVSNDLYRELSDDEPQLSERERAKVNQHTYQPF